MGPIAYTLQRALPLAFTALLVAMAHAQSPSETAAVKLHASVQSDPPRITLHWVHHPGTNGITIHRKLKSDTQWGGTYATVGASETQFQDNGVVAGVSYEYRVHRTGGGTAYGYVNAGIAVPPMEYKGRIVLLVDNTLAAPLAAELADLELDLKADGWTVVREDVSPNAQVPAVRNLVIGHYNAAPDQVKAVYIVGHVPVPYSGNTKPDGHDEHRGAWPCDGYYGELNGTWTDNGNYQNNAPNYKNNNVPGDGKFDQNDFPTAVELQVGRVDMHDMPAFTEGTVELTRQYLDRAHGFKRRQWVPQERGMIFDNLQWVSNPLGASAWRTLPAMVGPDDIQAPYQYGAPFWTYTQGQSYLWTYTSGGGGYTWTDGQMSYNSAGNIGSTEEYATFSSVGGVFNMSLGSYFGDWDNRNNFLKAPLAAGEALTNCWSGMPPWYFHHMALGENIGYSTLLTMNNSNGLYQPQNDGWQGSGIGRSHLGLMGDPTLRMTMVAPPSNLAVTNNNGSAAFNWTPAEDDILGYYIYQFDPATGIPSRIVPNLVQTTGYSDPAIPFIAGREYMVRAVKLEERFSGSYYNLSLGAITTAQGGGPAMDCEGVIGGPKLPGTACDDNDPATGNDTWTNDCECVGQLIDCLGTPGGPALPGTACDDGNASTINDTWTNDCACVGTLLPPDCEGTPGGSALPGTACDDGNASTINDTWTNDCACVGTLLPPDCEGTPGGSALPGTACDDSNASTINDTWTNDCACVGTLLPPDCEGTPGGSALPGTPCDDGDPNTGNDTWNNDCECVGQLIDCLGTPGGPALPGTACDDGNASTINDTWTNDCACVGTLLPPDCEGTPGGSALPGTACDDGNASTINDTWSTDCACVGTLLPPDCEGTPGGSALPGTACDDGNASTINDTWSTDCACVGILLPPDCEGTPGGPALPGTACDDGNASTINDTWTNDCACVGTLLPTDCEGVPGGPKMPGTPCDDGDPNTGNDTWSNDCECVGQLIDCLGAPGGSALPGTACDDGNASTINDTWSTDCACVGTLLPTDCEGVPGGPKMPGTPCDDGDPNTGNDTWNNDCECVGQLIDCLGTPGGSALPGTACDDGNASTINDTWTNDCACVGTLLPTDCEGVPGGPKMPGTPCDDGDPNTGNDTWSNDCECVGQLIDCLGAPGGSALPGTACDDGNASTINDTWTNDCACVGTLLPTDCEGVPGGPKMPGTPCDDGDPNTGNDTWSNDCECVGQLIDCLGTPGGSALPGTTCNDNDPGTGGDTWSTDCECVGTLLPADCEGVPGGSALPGTPCDDGDPLTGGDTWSDQCACVGESVDCAGVPGGTAYYDDCGDCVGGETQQIPNPDTDNDGLIDCIDNCPLDFNPEQTDFDGDGIGDACDNCPWSYNPDQADDNGNGFGNACDQFVGLAEIVAQGGFAVFPNPAMGPVTIVDGTGLVRHLIFTDATGRRVREERYAAQLGLDGLAAGVYVITGVSADGTAVAQTRFVKQ